MRVLFISQYYAPELGAASERIAGLSGGLSSLGHDVSVITGFPNYPYGKIFPGHKRGFFRKEKSGGVNITRAWLYVTPKKGAFSRLLNYLSFMFFSIIAGLLAKKPDVVIATSGPIFAGLSGCIVSMLRGARFVLDVRDIWPERIYAGTDIKRGVLIRCLERLELFIYAKAERIVAVTGGVRQNIIGKGVSSDKVVLVTNGVNAGVFGPSDAAVIRKSLGYASGDFVVIYAGTLGLLQDLDIIIESASRLARRGNIKFLVIGEGAMKKALEDAIREKGLKNIKLLPAVSQEELCGYINASDLGVNANTSHPHNAMAIPVKIFPYMACGKPVLLANEGEIEAIIRESGAGVCVRPGDADGFTNAILEFERNPEARLRCSEAGIRLVRERFSMERLAEALEKALRI